ncbi:hypothetical protein MUU47_21760 [Scandinavium sp. H11S7]|uniref:Uncharacterized protein n=1 Tax=Scandinavium hiltneri TaxID=2926519 RepID=A0ABT2E729_9ENTR|nr:hypothetical protein [Scandinavium hiltneri]MCS2163702.1 hypothetical protein [Scandinavium hiltneri]
MALDPNHNTTAAIKFMRVKYEQRKQNDQYSGASGLLIDNDPHRFAYIEAAITTGSVRIRYLVEHDGEIAPVGRVEVVPEGGLE